MVTFEDLIDEVQIIVVDDSDSVVDAIPKRINEALFEAVEAADIPEFKKVGIVTTIIDQAWTTMPSGFNGKLLFVGNDSTSLAIAEGGVQQLMETSPLLDESGPVHTVAVEGTTLYYQGIPDAATVLPILYRVFPTAFSASNDVVPDCIPPHLQTSVLVHSAAAKIFNTIEDGVEGEKVNTNAQLYLHNGYLEQLKAFWAKRRINAARSVWSY